jgi:DNA-binding NarL/FixJ family response regulator
MLSPQCTTELWALPAPDPVELRLAVIARDATLASRAMAALIAEGLAVRLEAAEREFSAVDLLARRPHVLVLHESGNQRALEHNLRWVARRLPAAMVVVVLPSTSRDVGPLLAAGADGLLFERDLEAALPSVVRAIAAGQVCVPAECRHLIQPPALSYRESQILGLSVAGLTNSQIASRLCISQSTVKSHLSSAFRRLGVHSRREAAALVFGPDEILRRTVLGTLQLSDAFARSEGG